MAVGEWIRKTATFIVGLVLILFDLAFFVSFVFELKRVWWFEAYPLLFLAGASCFLLLHLLFRRRPFLYVFVHEISHALASLLTGGRIHSIYVSDAGGTAKTDKTNLFVLLFPYVFPFLAVLVLLLYNLLDWAGNVEKVKPYFYFTMGLALTHHVFFTITSLLKGQRDVRKVGAVFGLGLIGFGNLLIFALVLSFLFGRVSVSHCFTRALFFFKDLLI